VDAELRALHASHERSGETLPSKFIVLGASKGTNRENRKAPSHLQSATDHGGSNLALCPDTEIRFTGDVSGVRSFSFGSNVHMYCLLRLKSAEL
jgi:hypothetical protein